MMYAWAQGIIIHTSTKVKFLYISYRERGIDYVAWERIVLSIQN